MAQRIILAIVGGYMLTACGAALGASLLAMAIPHSEAVTLMGMLAFVVYLTVLIWAFSEPRLARVWAILGFGGAIAFGMARAVVIMGG